ncbi:MAG: AMP-binding protein [Proteobacteria bacterium]|nr:AMP-binding protein [Pseudomonadota bacterium]MCP4922104.1 AMP-binding protein [Pseudomonadota bacterium]
MRGDQQFRHIPDVLAQAAARWPTASAIEDGITLSFKDLAAAVHRATGGLCTLGIGPGDRVAIWAPNCWEWVVAALAIHSRGAALVPINTRYKGPEARFILDRSDAKAIFTVDGFLGLDFAGMLGDIDLPVVRLKTPDWDAFLEAGTPGDAVDIQPNWTSDILFTSGTTGQPKGVVTTHAQSLRAFRDWSRVVGLSSDDRYLVVAPFFHCFGYKAGWLACLMSGATILPQATFDVDAVLARLAPDRVSVLPGPPALYQTLLQRDLSQHDLGSLRLAVTGAAVIPVTLIERMRTELGFETVITGYGLTEATGVATMCRFDDDPETIATTSGRAIPDVEVRVVDPDGQPVPAGEPGEVVVCGYNVMAGYLDDPAATAAAVRDGWLHTGDVGILNERGYLRITDRIKDMFIVGGFNAYPAEIEHALLEHPGVREVAVIGMADPRLGEVGCAFVVGETEGLIAWSRERMANFKVPRRVVTIDALPRNASGKVQKFKLRELV